MVAGSGSNSRGTALPIPCKQVFYLGGLPTNMKANMVGESTGVTTLKSIL